MHLLVNELCEYQNVRCNNKKEHPNQLDNMKIMGRDLFTTLDEARHTIHTPYRDMLPHHRITKYDVNLPNVLISI